MTPIRKTVLFTGFFLSLGLSFGLPVDATAQLPTATTIAGKMTVGWNLGNTLEAICGETAWGGAVTTQRLIDSVKAVGFNTVRIPCAWDCHATNGVIDPKWLARVKQVVDYCVNDSIYVILNIHWDGGWLEKNCTTAAQTPVNAKQQNYWTQIANYFKGEDEHLLFASANEPDVSDATGMKVLLSYHQTFINAVRATGGNNASRTLVIQGPSADISKTYTLMNTLPTDPIAGRMMVEIHYYTPYQFCLMDQDATWGKMFYYWGSGSHSSANPTRNATWGEETYIDSVLQLMKTKFGDKGIPVILGEYAAMKRNLSAPSDEALNLASRMHFYRCLVRSARNKGIIPYCWDINKGIFDRNTATVLDRDVINAMMGDSSTSQQLYVGANYHPHDDKNIAKIERDIQLMQAAGFNVVRMGHLAWDSYEPTEGHFDFAWFDRVMDLMDQAGIKVILDIAVRPAPLWLHHKFPTIDITNPAGNRLYPNHRYMEDVGDPMYQRYALRYADSLTRRYARHPALLAFGIDNESGDGPISYSETVRHRFIAWLKTKYRNLDSLNRAWASQRWSRRIGDFEEIGLPVSGSVNGAPERMLDFRRFISDEVNGFLLKVIGKVNANAPRALVNTNAWYYSPMKFFDYTTIAYSRKMTREGCGFYPGSSLTTNYGVMDALFGIERIQFESANPFWCTEFTTMTAVPGSILKSAYASLLYGNQMVCGWTWQSMHGGEEQYLEGMLDWDGIPNRKYDEYRRIAAEFKKIGKYFPYKPKAEIGLAFSFPSVIAGGYFSEQHQQQLESCFSIFAYRNIDTRVVDVARSALDYKLLFLPGISVMDTTTAKNIRDFVQKGGTVVMTGNSAVVDATGKVFSSTHPGLLADVFGIRVAGYEQTTDLNELSRKQLKDDHLELSYKGKIVAAESSRFEVLEPRGAEVLGSITSLDRDYPIVTSNRYGQGRAIYVGLPANSTVMGPLTDDLISALSIRKGPDVPPGVMARQIDSRHFLYLNVSGEPKMIPLKDASRSLLYDRDYTGNITIPPYEPEFIELK